MKAVAACLVCTIAVLAIVFHAWINDAATKPIRLQVHPQVGFAPLDVTLDVRVDAREDDRYLRVWLDSLTYSRASEISIEGAGLHLWNVEWKAVQAGEHDVYAQVGNALRVRATTTQRLLVSAP